MTISIGIVGAPGSGKSTFAARLYTSLRERGCDNAFLVQEYAREWVAAFKEKPDFCTQQDISNTQISREYTGELFDISICDSCVWLGGIYARHAAPKLISAKELAELLDYEEYLMGFTKYTKTVFVPLYDHMKEHPKGIGRAHSFEDSVEIQEKILSYAKENDIDLIHAPLYLGDRPEFIDDFAKFLLDK